MNFTELLASVSPSGDNARATVIPETWKQGRTAYGGQTARNGYSSQEMTLWNSKREPVMVGRQTIAIFA